MAGRWLRALAWGFLASPLAAAQPVNLARFQAVTADSSLDHAEAVLVTDGIVAADSAWASKDGGPHWCELRLATRMSVGSAQVFTGRYPDPPAANFELQYRDGVRWVPIPGAAVTANHAIERNLVFAASVRADRFRFLTTDRRARVKEIALYPPNDGAGFPLGTDLQMNLAWQRPVVASGFSSGGYANRAVDGFVDRRTGATSCWISAPGSGPHTLEVDLRSEERLGSAHLYSGTRQPGTQVKNFLLQYWTGNAWATIPGAVVAGNTALERVVHFARPVTTSRLRLRVMDPGPVRVRELCCFPYNLGQDYPMGTGVSFQPPPVARFEDFGDGFYELRTIAGNAALLADAAGARIAGDEPAEARQFQLLLNVGFDTWRLRNRASGRCLEVRQAATEAGAPIVEGDYHGAPHQNWRLVPFGGGDHRVVNVWSGLALDLAGAPTAGAAVVQQPPASRSTQRWRFNYVTHFPKKGLAGWGSLANQIQPSWQYDWSRNDGVLANGALKMPMQHNAGWPGWASLPKKYPYWNGRGRMTTLLGFNEPDHADQADMSVDQAIRLWPRLERMHVPLVSPAPANYGSWISSFMQRAVNEIGCRVDYMGVHWYGGPNGGNPQGFIDQLWNIQNTYKRPLWITEFSHVDWGGKARWTQEDTYSFFAEFLWRAEDLEWLKKYSMFVFRGDGPAHPWDRTGPRGNLLKSSSTTLTALGELYAAWDGDQEVRDHTPYFIYSKSTRKRLANTGGRFPAPATIRDSSVSAQWVLVPAGNGNHYLVSLRDGSRLAANTSTVSLLPPGTRGRSVEWRVRHHQHGWRFLDHPAANHRLHMVDAVDDGTADPAGIRINVAEIRWTGDNVQFFLIKPWRARPIVPPAPPARLVAAEQNGSVRLAWSSSPSADRLSYALERAERADGPFTSLAEQLTGNIYTDAEVVAGRTYFYRLHAIDWVELASPAVTASVTLAAPPPATYADWAAVVLADRSPAERDWSADPDGDSRANVWDYLHLTNPGGPKASSFRVFLGDDGRPRIALRKNPLATDWRLELLSAPALSTRNWTPADPVIESSIPDGDAVELILRPADPDPTGVFYRLRATPLE